MWIFIIEGNNKSNDDLIVFLMIYKATTNGFFQRPALGVDDAPFDMFFRGDVPKLFDAKGVSLRLRLVV